MMPAAPGHRWPTDGLEYWHKQEHMTRQMPSTPAHHLTHPLHALKLVPLPLVPFFFHLAPEGEGTEATQELVCLALICQARQETKLAAGGLRPLPTPFEMRPGTWRGREKKVFIWGLSLLSLFRLCPSAPL